MKTTHFLLAATFGIALALTFSCSSDDGDGNDSSSPSDSNNNLAACKQGTVIIGTQTWHKCNLDVVPSTGNSWCYDNLESNCKIYGRLYDWAAAMTVCPSDFHLPTNADWDELMRFVDGTSGTSSPYTSETAGKHLKATSGWNDDNGKSGNGSDTYGFSALPGGRYNGSNFNYAGYSGYWWSATESNSFNAYYRYMRSYERANWEEDDKSVGYSVRCLKN